MFINKLIVPLFRKNYLQIYQTFSKRKGLEENIKSKQSRKVIQNVNSQTSNQNLLQLSKIKVLNMQFFPMTLLLTPTIFSLESFCDPSFLLGELLVEKYASLALLMNLDFQNNRAKAITILTLMASLHALTGYYSIITPFGMALLTILSPFKFCHDKEKYTEIQFTRINKMTHIRMVYFFLFMILTTIKALHYEATYTLQKKLDQFNQENLFAVNQKNKL